MGKKSLNPWLADCVWHELAAVITWKKELTAGIKKDPESRFEDDGSNFRSRVSGQEQYLVQLMEVLSVAEPVKVILSDGVTKVKAQLSSDIVATLEAETGENFSSEVTGDVFRLRDFTVVSTIFGPTDDFVQLTVDEIEYEHHLRKVQGQPKPIEEDENVELLIKDITHLRCPPDAVEQLYVDRSGNVISPHQPNRQSSTRVPSTQSQFLPSGIQSQYPASRKRPSEPTMATEGYEVVEGLNLNKPLRATSGSPASKRAPAAKSAAASMLLGVFEQMQARETLPPPPPQPKTDQKRAREASPPLSTITADSPAKRPQPSSGMIAETPTKLNGQPAETLSDSDLEPEEQTRPQCVQHIAPLPSNRSPPSAQPLQVTDIKSCDASSQPRVPYGRRKIPANQQKLLDDKSSWIPSLPGHRFPQPNVPIELLTKWNKIAKPSPRKPGTMQETQSSTPLQVGSPVDRPMDDDDDIVESSNSLSISSSDSEDEEFDSSQWPPSPSQRQLELPPDSSWDDDNVVQGTQQDDLEVAVPQALPIRKTASKQERSHQAPVRHALPPRPQVAVPSQAAMDDVFSPPSTTGLVSPQILPPSSPLRSSHPVPSTAFSHSTVRSAQYAEIQATTSQPQASAQRPDVLPRGSQVSTRSSHPAVQPSTQDRESPVRSQVSQRSLHNSPVSALRAISRADQIERDLAEARRNSAELESQKRRRMESSRQIPAEHNNSARNISSPDLTASQESPPRSSFRNPTMVGRKPPTAQSCPVGTPLQRQTPASDVGILQQSSPTLHGAARPIPQPAAFMHRIASITPSASHPWVSPEHDNFQSAQQNLQTARNATRLPMPSGPTIPSVNLQPRHPDEMYRLARREHFGRSGRREKWIKDNYERVNHGNKTIASMLELYKAQHPEDRNTDLEQITRAASIVFRSSREALATTKFRRINLPATPAPGVDEESSAAQSSSQAHSRPAQPRRGDTASLQLDGPNTQVAPSSSPRGRLRENAAPITQIDGANDQAQVVPPIQRSTAADNSSRSTLDERVAQTLMSESSSDALKEFCWNWLSIRPGGAFATSQPALPKVSRNVDVLQWEI